MTYLAYEASLSHQHRNPHLQHRPRLPPSRRSAPAQVDPWTLVHREQPPLGTRRHLRRRPIPSPNRHHPTHPRNPTQPHDQHHPPYHQPSRQRRASHPPTCPSTTHHPQPTRDPSVTLQMTLVLVPRHCWLMPVGHSTPQLGIDCASDVPAAAAISACGSEGLRTAVSDITAASP